MITRTHLFFDFCIPLRILLKELIIIILKKKKKKKGGKDIRPHSASRQLSVDYINNKNNTAMILASDRK